MFLPEDWHLSDHLFFEMDGGWCIFSDQGINNLRFMNFKKLFFNVF